MDCAKDRKTALEFGVKFYSSSTKCKFGNIAPRITRTCNCTCIDCKKEKSKKLIESRRIDESKKKKTAEASKKYAEKNKEKIAIRNKEWRDRNPGYSSAYYRDNREKMIKQNKEWNKENRDRVAELMRERRSTPSGKIECFCRNYIRIILTKTRTEKLCKTESLLGYKYEDLISHIQRQFTKGMSWDNYGEWHIDHIIPISHMIKTGVTSPSEINALPNLRPIWASENLNKRDKLEFLI